MSQTDDVRRRVTLISHDVIGPRMAGPGIRYLRIAETLADEFAVILAAPRGSEQISEAPLSWLPYDTPADGALAQALAEADVAFVPAILLAQIPALRRPELPVAVDCYDPYLAESLAFAEGEPASLLADLSQAYLAGDFFVCASSRQRDWLLGLLEAHGRINPWTVRDDPALRWLVDLVPFGLPVAAPAPQRPVLRGVWPGIGPGDRVILWGGGIWPWLDPLTAVRAIALLAPQQPDVRLVFPGAGHPNPRLAAMAGHAAPVRAAAVDLGLLDRHVFFGDWLPYADWPAALSESDVALTLHQDTLEARLAYRSRALDYIWAGLPIVAADGDAISELVREYGVGHVVGCGDVAGVADALASALARPRAAWAAAFVRARDALTWEKAVRSLAGFCRRSRLAADRQAGGLGPGNAYYRQRLAELAAERDEWQTAAGRHEWEARQHAAAADLHARERDYWQALAGQMGQERDEWRWQADFNARQAQAYERGRFIRLMQRWHAFRRSLSRGGKGIV